MEPDQDALERLQKLERYMELNDFLLFREHDEYLWLKLRASGYRDAEAWKKLIARGTHRREEAWQIAREMARSILGREWQALGVEAESRDLAAVSDQFAEQLMVEQDIVPPTFTEWTQCESCGRMPVPQRFGKQQSPNCPWCLPGVADL
jgi:hypothetical protein